MIKQNQSESIVNVASKIHALREKVKEVESSKMQAGKAHYNYLSESSLTETIRPAMQELGLIIVPTESISDTGAYVLQSDDGHQPTTKTVLLSSIDATYLVVDTASGEWLTIASSASGADTQDKGTNKAKTGAFKNALQALAMISSPAREDPDTTPSTSGSTGGGGFSSDVGGIELKYGEYKGKTIKEVWDTYPEAVEKMAMGSNWLAGKAKEFIDSIKA